MFALFDDAAVGDDEDDVGAADRAQAVGDDDGGAIDEETLGLMKETALWMISSGLESGSERIRREVLKRNYSNQDVITEENLKRAYGIDVQVREIGPPVGRRTAARPAAADLKPYRLLLVFVSIFICLSIRLFALEGRAPYFICGTQVGLSNHFDARSFMYPAFSINLAPSGPRM
mgnify:CR=1 FL=1